MNRTILGGRFFLQGTNSKVGGDVKRKDKLCRTISSKMRDMAVGLSHKTGKEGQRLYSVLLRKMRNKNHEKKL